MFRKQSVIILPLSITLTQRAKSITTVTWCYTPAKETCVLRMVELQRQSVAWKIGSGMRQIFHAKVMLRYRTLNPYTAMLTSCVII